MGKQLWETVPGAALTMNERKFIVNAASIIEREMIKRNGEKYRPLMLNIGVMWGASMHCIRAGSKKCLLTGIDKDYETYPVKHQEELNAVLMRGDSTRIPFELDSFRAMRIDLLFVDGSHKYEDVKKDIAGWVSKVLPGGMVIFHDYTPAQVDLDRDPTLRGVRRAVNDWRASKEYTGWVPTKAPGSLAAFRRL